MTGGDTSKISPPHYLLSLRCVKNAPRQTYVVAAFVEPTAMREADIIFYILPTLELFSVREAAYEARRLSLWTRCPFFAVNGVSSILNSTILRTELGK